MSIINDYSRKLWIYILRSKDQAFESFQAWKTLVENQTEKRVKRIRTDNGLEFCNASFDKLCVDSGIARHKTVRMTPQ